MKHLLILSAFMFWVGCESERIAKLENDVETLENDVENFAKMFKGIINGDKNSIILYNADGKEIVYLGESEGGNGFLRTFNADGNETAYLGTGEGGDGLLRTSNSDGNETAYLGTSDVGNGMLITSNSDGNETATLGGGHLSVFNKAGETVGYFGTNKDNDGVATLHDRYGDFGWGVSGKK